MDDYAQLCELWREGDALHHQWVPEVFAPPVDNPRPRELVAEQINGNQSAILVADEESGRLLGLALIEVRDAPPLPIMVQKRIGHVGELVVRSTVRRQGVGRALMSRAAEWLAERGAKEIRLNVWEWNAGAVEFYRNLGYETGWLMMRNRLTGRRGADETQ
jgi:ribosomal protein S18 acetylase RimI-like enzyme